MLSSKNPKIILFNTKHKQVKQLPLYSGQEMQGQLTEGIAGQC